MNTEQFNQCVEQYADRLFRFAFSSLRNREQAEDVVQESFARVWEKHKTVDFAKAKSYLFTIAHHAMVDEVRQRMQTSDLKEIATLTDPKASPILMSTTFCTRPWPPCQRHNVTPCFCATTRATVTRKSATSRE